MKPAIAKKWVAALRSGEYKQTTGDLRRGDAFCCLGVLCNLHAQAHPKIAAEQLDSFTYMGRSGYPADPVRKWAGLRSESGRYSDGHSLAVANDSGRSFKEIAKLIEANVRKL